MWVTSSGATSAVSGLSVNSPALGMKSGPVASSNGTVLVPSRQKRDSALRFQPVGGDAEPGKDARELGTGHRGEDEATGQDKGTVGRGGERGLSEANQCQQAVRSGGKNRRRPGSVAASLP